MMIKKKNMRAYDCEKCSVHFNAETPNGDAFDFDPLCPQCGESEESAPCFGDRRNVSTKDVREAWREGLDIETTCRFPSRLQSGIVELVPQEEEKVV